MLYWMQFQEQEALHMRFRVILGLIMLISLPLSAAHGAGPASPILQPHAASGARLWYMQGNELWAMHLDGSNAQLIASDIRRAERDCPSYFVSSDGQRVSYQRTDGQIAITAVESGQTQNIAAGQIGGSSWSPRHSQTVVFALNDDVFLYDSGSGGAPEAIASGGGRFACPVFAPDGQHIAFLEATGSVFNVTIVRTDSREWRSLGTTAPSPAGPEQLCGVVKWSPDSTKLLVDYGQPVFVFYLAGGTPTQIGGIDHPTNHFWSPASDQIAFKEADGSLWLINPDGSGQRPLVAEPVGDIAWDPIGRSAIAYTTMRDGTGDLWIINTQNGQKQQLTSDDSFRERHPTWSPDGNALIFERTGPGGEEQGIWRVMADGSGLTQLASSGSDLQVH